MSLGDFERKSDGENNWDAASTRDLAGYEHPSDDESTTRDKPSDSEDDLFVRTRRSKSIAPPGELKRPLPLSDWEIQAADESAAIARSAKRPKMDPQPESGSTKVWRKNPAHPYAAESQEILAWTSTEHPNGKRDWSIIDGPNSLIPRRIMKAKEPTRKTCRDKQIQQFDETEFMIELQANAMLHLKIFFPDLKAWDILEGESNFRGQSGPVRRHPPGPFITPLYTYPVTWFCERHERAEHMDFNLGTAFLMGCGLFSRDQHAATVAHEAGIIVRGHFCGPATTSVL
ncbi:hypothetical protein BC567DRAFT_212455 [Phyllosticta citribraziliensis]